MKRIPSQIAGIDPTQLKQWTDEGRQRYSDQDLLDQLTACAQALGCSPTMREFETSDVTSAHPQTIIERFGSWNIAKRKAGLRARRFATNEELLTTLKELGALLKRTPTATDVKACPKVPALTTFTTRFGSLPVALQKAGFDVAASADERLEKAIAAGVALAHRLGGAVPTMGEWKRLRAGGENLPSEWQIYRLCQTHHGKPWAVFTQLVAQRLQFTAAA